MTIELLTSSDMKEAEKAAMAESEVILEHYFPCRTGILCRGGKNEEDGKYGALCIWPKQETIMLTACDDRINNEVANLYMSDMRKLNSLK